jgi:16S rRNA (guanine527-N7)-methyltransferase
VNAIAPTLREGLARLAVRRAEKVESLLDRYLDELERWNPRFGFVKAESRSDFIVKHVLDSLAAWRSVEEEANGGSILDVGAGAGFPGVPLAVALPANSIVLLERSTKKVAFLRSCKALLGLVGMEVIQGDLADASGRGMFDVVTFRALAPLSRFLTDVGTSGLRFRTLIAYKGRITKAAAELEDVRRSTAHLRRAEIVPITVPFLDEERCVVVLSTGPASDRY